jgi:hypothetical protein
MTHGIHGTRNTPPKHQERLASPFIIHPRALMRNPSPLKHLCSVPGLEIFKIAQSVRSFILRVR